MRTVKVTKEDGDYFITRINGTDEQIKNHYAIGSIIGTDDNRKIVAVEIIN